MDTKSRLKMLNSVFIQTKAYYILIVFVITVFVCAGIIYFIEPSIISYGDAVWYCFVDLFTIGFGDQVAQTAIGRVLSILLTAYATVVIAVLTGVAVSFYNEICNNRYQITKNQLLNKLENLDKLSKEELKELSNNIKKIN